MATNKYLKQILVPLKLRVLPSFCHWIFSMFDRSTRVIKFNEPCIDGPKIYASWHGRQYCFLRLNPRDKLNILISKSNDGEIVTQVLLRLGFHVIRGSASRGGTAAVRQMLEVLENGENVAFTVDGPRGPVYDVKAGIIKLAQLSGVPIIPVIPSTYTKLLAKSWDIYNLPVFFSRIVFHYGTPIYINRDAGEEEIELKRLELAEIMRNLTLTADKQSGCETNEHQRLAKLLEEETKN